MSDISEDNLNYNEDFKFFTKFIRDSSIYPDHIKFLIRYLQKKKSHKAKITQEIFILNDINFNLKNLESEIFSRALIDMYFKQLKKTDKYYYLKLTDRGIEFAKYIELDKPIIIYNWFVRLVIFLVRTYRSIIEVIKKVPASLINLLYFVFVKKFATTFIVLAAIATILMALRAFNIL